MPSRGQRPDPEEARHSGMDAGEPTSHPPCYYPSNAADTFILNAVTGEPYPFKVGSAESLSLFRVTDASGKYDERGYELRPGARCTDDTTGKSPNQLYYNTPQEYEAHIGDASVREAVTAAWAARVKRLCPLAASEPDAEPTRSFSRREWDRYKTEHPRARGRPSPAVPSS